MNLVILEHECGIPNRAPPNRLERYTDMGRYTALTCKGSRTD
jgi:hypothetical protein